MPRLLVLLVCASTSLACDPGRERGGAGANCRASAECEDRLQCVAAVCTDDASNERARAECAAAEARQSAALEAVTAELRALEGKHERLAAEKAALADRIAGLTAETEEARLTADKAALDAAPKPRSPPRSPRPHAGDPLADL